MMGSDLNDGSPATAGQRTREPGLVSSALWRHWLLVLVVGMVCAAMGFALSTLKEERYTAQARLFMSSSAPFDGVGSASYVNDPNRYIANQAGLVASRPVLDAAADDGVATDAKELREALDVTAGRDTDVVIIDVEGASPTQAANRANAVAEAYRDFLADRVSEQTDALVKLSTSPGEKAQVLKRAAAYGDGVALLEPATEPLEPSSPLQVVDTLLALLAGLALGVLVALLLEVRRSARSAHVVRSGASRGPEGSERSEASEEPGRQAPVHRADGSRREPGAPAESERRRPARL